MDISIKDIAFIDGTDVIMDIKGELYELKLPVSTTIIEQQLEKIRIVHMLNSKEADYYNIPPIVVPFYYYIVKSKGNIPTQEQLLKAYRKLYSKDMGILVDRKDYDDIQEIHIKERIYRAYPSIVRDFHFYAMCSESKAFDAVILSTREDMENNTDLYLEIGGFKVRVELFVNTAPSEEWYNTKEKKQAELDSVVVPMMCKLDDQHSKKVGDFYLYTERHVKILEKGFMLKALV